LAQQIQELLTLITKNCPKKRQTIVKSYLIQNGVEAGKLNAIGRGEKDLKYPECEPATKCPEWKNRANRRVYFEAK
jgi:hypothetical protein